MRLRKTRSRVLLVALMVALVVGMFAAPASASHERNQFIRTNEKFESPASDCANGRFRASGVIDATGRARSCAQDFRAPGIVEGTTQLHNGDRLTVHWKVQCNDPSGAQFSCAGQWLVDGPNWTGGGNARANVDFTVGPYGAISFVFNGSLHAT